MSELSNYSIESDHTVVLAFKDGRRVRVPIGQLPHHLDPLDLEKIRSAIKLRRDFIRRHMPKVALVMVAGGLIALLSVGGQAVAQLFQPAQPVPVQPSHTGIVRSEILQTPSASPGMVAADTAASSPHSSKLAYKPAAKRALSAPQPNPAPSPTPASAPDPTPSPSPAPSPSPSPSVSPVPPVTDPPATDTNGKVAGCATTAADPTLDCSMP